MTSAGAGAGAPKEKPPAAVGAGAGAGAPNENPPAEAGAGVLLLTPPNVGTAGVFAAEGVTVLKEKDDVAPATATLGAAVGAAVAPNENADGVAAAVGAAAGAVEAPNEKPAEAAGAPNAGVAPIAGAVPNEKPPLAGADPGAPVTSAIDANGFFGAASAPWEGVMAAVLSPPPAGRFALRNLRLASTDCAHRGSTRAHSEHARWLRRTRAWRMRASHVEASGGGGRTSSAFCHVPDGSSPSSASGS
jgi:hypothetical protein